MIAAIVIVVAVFWAVFVWAGYEIGKSKNRSEEGFLLPFFLGFIGLIVIALLPKKEERTRMCNHRRPFGAPRGWRCDDCGAIWTGSGWEREDAPVPPPMPGPWI